MKKDLDLIRKIFFKLEEFPYQIQKDYNYKIEFEGYTKEKINFHLQLMKQAKFIDGIIHKSVINKHLEVRYETLEITWEGYDFFNSIRDNKIWNTFKKKFGNGELPFSIIMEICKNLILHFISKQIKY